MKRIIKLTESDLHRIINRVAHQIMTEDEEFNSDHYSDDMFDETDAEDNEIENELEY